MLILDEILKIGLPEAAHQRDEELFLGKILKISLPEATHQRDEELVSGKNLKISLPEAAYTAKSSRRCDDVDDVDDVKPKYRSYTGTADVTMFGPT